MLVTSILIILMRVVLNILYFVLKLFPQKNKVVFISRQSDKASYDFQSIENRLLEIQPEYETVFLCKTLGNKVSHKAQYAFHMLEQMYHIATSKTVVLDGYCIVASVLKHKKNVKIIQLWHALGLLKKFGYASVGHEEGSNEKIARLMRMHRNYDYVICSSPHFKKEIATAYGVSEDIIVPLGLPRMDYLTDETQRAQTKAQFFKSYKALDNGKKTIMYVPTFRKGKAVEYNAIVERVDLTKYNLIIKFHDSTMKIYADDTVTMQEAKMEGFFYLSVADYVISDYSAIVFEAALADKPLYLYCYDVDTYLDRRGLFIDYEAIPAVISKDASEIIKAIEDNVVLSERVNAFKDEYLTYRNANITNALASLIALCVRGEEINIEKTVDAHTKDCLAGIE